MGDKDVVNFMFMRVNGDMCGDRMRKRLYVCVGGGCDDGVRRKGEENHKMVQIQVKLKFSVTLECWGDLKLKVKYNIPSNRLAR